MPLRFSNKIIPTVVHQIIWGYCVFNLSSSLVKADEFDTLQFRASVSKTYDSNLFRRASNETSEQITTSTAGVRLDKTYSLQRVMLDLSYVDYKYHENDYLDFGATNYSGTWFWSLTPNLTGTLSSDRTQNMNSFGDFRNTTKNVRTTTNNQFRMLYSPHNVWSLILGLSQLKLENSEVFTAITDFDAVGLDYGLMYKFSSGTYITLLGHSRTGELKKRPLDPVLVYDNGYKENEYEINLNMAEDGYSKLTAKLSYLDHEYDNFKIRSYNTYVGNVDYEFRLTGKLRTYFNFSRALSGFETNNTTYSLADVFSTRVTYDISSKIQAGLNLSYGKRDFEGRGQFDTSGRSDIEQSYSASVRWNPTKNVGLTLTSTKSNRNSTLASFDYDDTLTYASVELRI